MSRGIEVCSYRGIVSRTYVYGVATISRLLRIIGLFCKRALEKRRYSAKETHNFKEPTNRSHPIAGYDVYLSIDSESYTCIQFCQNICMTHISSIITPQHPNRIHPCNTLIQSHVPWSNPMCHDPIFCAMIQPRESMTTPQYPENRVRMP